MPDALMHGLWSRLTIHQERHHPFKLTPLPAPQDADAVGRYGLHRREELDGFVEGLYCGLESLPLPEDADEALRHLAEIASFCLGGDGDERPGQTRARNS